MAGWFDLLPIAVQGVGSAIDYFRSKDIGKQLQQMGPQIQQLASPFPQANRQQAASQLSGFMSGSLGAKDLPNFGEINTALDRMHARTGKSFSGNAVSDTANTLQNEKLKYMQFLADTAGANINPSHGADLLSQFYSAQLQNQANRGGGFMETAQGLFDVLGKGKNLKSIADFFSSGGLDKVADAFAGLGIGSGSATGYGSGGIMSTLGGLEAGPSGAAFGSAPGSTGFPSFADAFGFGDKGLSNLFGGGGTAAAGPLAAFGSTLPSASTFAGTSALGLELGIPGAAAGAAPGGALAGLSPMLGPAALAIMGAFAAQDILSPDNAPTNAQAVGVDFGSGTSSFVGGKGQSPQNMGTAQTWADYALSKAGDYDNIPISGLQFVGQTQGKNPMLSVNYGRGGQNYRLDFPGIGTHTGDSSVQSVLDALFSGADESQLPGFENAAWGNAAGRRAAVFGFDAAPDADYTSPMYASGEGGGANMMPGVDNWFGGGGL